ncbi:MAG: class II glutamine amidotransferase [Archangium sp.]
MSQVLALITSDAALLRCELDRVRARVTFDSNAVVGVGGWQDGQVVQRSYGVGVPLDDAWEAPESEAAMLASRVLSVGQGVDNGTQPFRFRQWLFAAAGGLEKADAIRERLREELPEFLQGALRGPTWEEIAFAHFLAGLREIGRIEDAQLDPETAASKLAAAARAIEQVSASVGVPGRPSFSLVASNGRVIVATSRGGARLSYTLLEGHAECGRHELKEGEAAVRDHRRVRSVVVASGVEPGDGWVALPDGATLAVDRRLSITVR